MSEYWIAGIFNEWWGGKSFYCSELDIFVPKQAMGYKINNKTFISSTFAEQQLSKLAKLQETNQFTFRNKVHYYLYRFCRALNKPYEELLDKDDQIKPPPTSLP